MSHFPAGLLDHYSSGTACGITTGRTVCALGLVTCHTCDTTAHACALWDALNGPLTGHGRVDIVTRFPSVLR